MTDPRISQLAAELLTDKQHAIWDRRHRREWSWDTITFDLLIHRSTVRSHYDAACLKMQKAGVQFTPDGRPYLEEHTTA